MLITKLISKSFHGGLRTQNEKFKPLLFIRDAVKDIKKSFIKLLPKLPVLKFEILVVFYMQQYNTLITILITTTPFAFDKVQF